jgi:CRP-like cAMP-binding protein
VTVPELARIETIVFLQSVDLFSFCKAEEILRIAAIAGERRLAAGERIFDVNDPADCLYCVVQGEVRVDGPGDEERTVHPLGAFGVKEILSGRLRGGRAVTEVESLLLVISAEDLFDLLANNIDIVKALFRHLFRDRPA